MKIQNTYVKSFLKGLLILVEATILSIILVFVIAVFMGRDFFLSLLFFPEEISIPYPYNLIGFFLTCLGFVLVIWANFTLLYVGKIGLKAREPFHIPSTLIVGGPYKFSRNPIYLAVIWILFGFAIWVGSLIVFLITILLFLIFWKWFVSWEEKKLEEAFGDEYLEYKKRVRRWL